jgi:DNA-binding SARP family transcriptional activator
VIEPGDVRVLGPVEATGPAGPMVLHGSRQRAVLGALALHAGTVLPVARLVNLLWGDDPPRTAVRTVHSHVARIRQALDDCGLPSILVTRGHGYVLEVPSEMVDVHRFERHLRVARKDIAAGAIDRAVASLRRGIALWRGDAFVDAALAGWGTAEIDRLHESRFSAVEDLWDCLLRLGEHADAVRELPRLLATHPTRERLAGLHMLALYRTGRHTDALEAFHGLRRGLADEFGVDPGPELLALHTSILRRDPGLELRPSVSRPAQLPASVGHFTGRDDELAALHDVLDAPDGEWPIVLISGAAGMGKTALAVQWAHQVATSFPDGQLFIDLRGHDPRSALPATEALAHLLRGLGVADERLPGEPAERAALYRSLLHDRRCVVVVDNAPSAEHVLPLVPGAGPALLVVTSRHSGAALGSRHAVHTIELDALDDTSSLALLTRVLGADLVARQPDASAQLVRLCGGMPLALRIAAARLVDRPDRSVGELAAELAGANRLGSLAVDGDPRTVRAVLASAYLPLATEEAMMFRRLALSPGSTVSTALGAALCAVPVEQGRRAAEGLSCAHLLRAVGPDRFRFHSLTREFARQVARTDDAAALTETADRLIDWYLVVAAGANRAVGGDRDLAAPTLRHPPPELPFPAQRHAALAFLSTERDNLLPVVRYALANGRPAAAWQLTRLLSGCYDATSRELPALGERGLTAVIRR